jgi:hypothetical protein
MWQTRLRNEAADQRVLNSNASDFLVTNDFSVTAILK